MSKVKIAELRKARAERVAQARAILDRAEREKRELSPEEQAQFDALMSEVDSLRQRIERLEQLLELESEIITEDVTSSDGERAQSEEDEDEEERARHRRRGAQILPEQRTLDRQRASEYRIAFWNLMAGKPVSRAEARALGLVPDSAGGYTVPDEFVRQLIQKLEDENVMRRICYVREGVTGEGQIPVEVDIGEAQWIGEAEEYPELDVEFGQVIVGAHKLGRITKVSEELMQDSFLAIEEYMANVFGRAFGRAEERAMVNGDGSGKPLGVVRSAQVGVTVAAAAVTGDDLIDLQHALRRPYRERASWLMEDSTLKAIRKLKDDQGQYIWQPGLREGEPDTLLGRPVYVSPYMPQMEAGAKSILFGDFSYYWILVRRERVMQRLNELYAARGQVGFRMYQRIDGRLVLPEAIVALQHGS